MPESVVKGARECPDPFLLGRLWRAVRWRAPSSSEGSSFRGHVDLHLVTDCKSLCIKRVCQRAQKEVGNRPCWLAARP